MISELITIRERILKLENELHELTNSECRMRLILLRRHIDGLADKLIDDGFKSIHDGSQKKSKS